MSSPAEAGRVPPGGSRPADRAHPADRDVSRDDLLGYLSRNTLDADYALVAARRGVGGRRTPGSRAGTALVLAVFVVLVVTLFSQTTRDAGAERDQLVDQVTQQRAGLEDQQAQVARLGADNSRARARLLSDAGSGLLGRTRRLALLAGTIPAKGPGVLVEVDDAPGATKDTDRVLDTDLQKLVNGLWQAGAEAISVNGQRLTSMSAIRQAGEAVNVNFVGLTRPYRVQVLGDPDTLPSRFAETTSGATWFDLQRRVGLRFSMEERSSLTLPAAERTTLRYATAARPEGGTS